MQANWSLILNVILLVGVVVTIGLLLRARKQSLTPERVKPSPGAIDKPSSYESPSFNDDIIAVRKVNKNSFSEEAYEPRVSFPKPQVTQAVPAPLVSENAPRIEPKVKTPIREPVGTNNPKPSSSLMMFLLAKENRQFAGYELLQTVLAAGLRFGEGHLFHRHQFPNGQGPVLCSLAAATATGVFDLQNIGAFSVRGLCLFMHTSSNPGIDKERFSIMIETARQLSEGLDALLLDDQRKPLTEERLARYTGLLSVEESQYEYESE